MVQISIALGIFIGLLTSFIQSLGLTIQRKSHVLNGRLPEAEQRVEHRRPLWLLGFAVFLSSNIVGSVVQIASLPVVILAPLGAVSLLWNAFFARLLLGDVFSYWMVLGTLFIAGGAVLIAIFGIVPEPTRSIEDLLRLFNRPAFIIYFSLLGTAVLVCLVITHIVEFSLRRRLKAVPITPPSEPSTGANASALATGLTENVVVATENTPLLDVKGEVPAHLEESKSVERTRIWMAISYASISGIISGMALLFAKSGVQLLVLTLQGDNQFWRWQSWMLLIGLVTFALLQLWYLHKGLTLADPTLVCPSGFCFYNLSSIVNGLIYYDQLDLISPLHLGLVGLGIFVLLAGVWIVSLQASAGVVDVATEWVDQEEEMEEETTTPPPESEDAECSVSPRPSSGHSRSPSSVLHRGRPPNMRPILRIVSEPYNARSPSPSESVDEEMSRSLDASSVLSPGSRSSRRRRRTLTSGPSEVTPGPTISSGFSIGLSPMSPGFSLIPRRMRRRRTISESSRPILSPPPTEPTRTSWFRTLFKP